MDLFRFLMNFLINLILLSVICYDNIFCFNNDTTTFKWTPILIIGNLGNITHIGDYFWTSSSKDNVTYKDIGTFSKNDFYDPINRPNIELPYSPNRINPKFYLFNRENRKRPFIIEYQNFTKLTKNSIKNFNPLRQTKIIVHGFIDNRSFGDWMDKLKNAFLRRKNLNVIIVEWKNGNFFPYVQVCSLIE